MARLLCLFILPNTAVTLDWKAFLSVKNYFYQHQSIPIIIKGESETCPNFWNRHIILSLKFIGSFEAAALSLFLSTSEYHHYYQGRKWNMPEFLKSPYNSLSKVYQFIWSCCFVVLVLNLIFPPSCFSLLSSGHSLCYLPHFAPTASRKKKQAAKNIL